MRFAALFHCRCMHTKQTKEARLTKTIALPFKKSAPQTIEKKEEANIIIVMTAEAVTLSMLLQKERREPPLSTPCIYNMADGGIYWYEEETIEEEEMASEQDYTEVTFESECPTEDDILLGTLPPVPPLAENEDLKQIDFLSEQQLLDVLRKKRDEEPKKTTVPGTGRRQHQPRPKQKRLAPSKTVPPLKSHANTEHHSPIGVWEFPLVEAPQQETANNQKQALKARRRVTSPRVKNIDAILLRHDERKAFRLRSADPRQQIQSLQKFWLDRINHQMDSIDRQLVSLGKEVLKTEETLAQVLQNK